MRARHLPLIGCLVPAIAGADLLNTAALSYRDASGLAKTATSNTVLVPLAAPTLQTPADPDLSGINGRTYAPGDEISFAYNGAYTGFNWSFAEANVSAARDTSGAAAAPASASMLSPAPRLALASLALKSGLYQIQVQAVNGALTSHWVGATITIAAGDLSGVEVYPNPWKAGRNTGGIVFDRLSADCTVKIFTASGHKVIELTGSGRIPWDLKNSEGQRAASGIYLYIVSDRTGRQTRGKLGVVR